jgi:hypothetical protein
MKIIKNSAILWLCLAFLILASGCAMQVRVNGGPHIDVPTTSGSLGRSIFPPNNIAVVVNATDAPLMLNVYQIQIKSYKVRLDPGQQAELPFYQVFSNSEALVVASMYDPKSGMILDTVSRTFYLTNNGGNTRAYNWVIKRSGYQHILNGY